MSCQAACQHSEQECLDCILNQGADHFGAILALIGEAEHSGHVTADDINNMRHSVKLSRDINYQALVRAGARS